MSLPAGNCQSQSQRYFTTGGLPPNQFVFALNPLRLTTSNFIFQLNTCGYSHYVTPSLTRGWVCCLQLLLAITTAVILRVRVPRNSLSYFTVSHSRVPQPGGPGPRIYIPQEQGGPGIPPGNGFPFRRLLRLAGPRWRYSNTRPHGITGN
jgi:hypothetical protein